MAPTTGLMGKAKRNVHFFKHFQKAAKGQATLENENLEDAVAYLRSFKMGNVTQGKIVWRIGAVVTLGAIVLFLIKLSNTSEMALRYNQHAQEEMGMWVLGILGVAALTILFAFTTFLGKKRYDTWRGLVVTELRNRAGRDADNKTLYESLLRELGA